MFQIILEWCNQKLCPLKSIDENSAVGTPSISSNPVAIGLDNRRPIDLLSSAAGAEAVENALTRMEYGVYA